MSGRVKVIKRRAVTTGQLRRGPAGEAGSSPELAAATTPEQTLAQAAEAALSGRTPESARLEPQPPETEGSARVEVVSVGPESSELRVHCSCGSETVIALNHPAEDPALGGAR